MKLLAKFSIVLVFLMISNSVSYADKVDVLKSEIKTSINQDEKLKYLLKLTDLYLETNDTLAKKYSLKSLEIAEKTDNDQLKILAYHHSGRAQQNVGSTFLITIPLAKEAE